MRKLSTENAKAPQGLSTWQRWMSKSAAPGNLSFFPPQFGKVLRVSAAPPPLKASIGPNLGEGPPRHRTKAETEFARKAMQPLPHCVCVPAGSIHPGLPVNIHRRRKRRQRSCKQHRNSPPHSDRGRSPITPQEPHPVAKLGVGAWALLGPFRGHRKIGCVSRVGVLADWTAPRADTLHPGNVLRWPLGKVSHAMILPPVHDVHNRPAILGAIAHQCRRNAMAMRE